MALSTRFTELFGVRHPIMLAPMGGSAGGALAAAVSRGGGLGMLGSGNGEREWLDREASIVAAGTGQPWGIGFLSWAVDVGAVERALAYGPRAVMLSFGDPGPFIDSIRQAGALLIIQVTDLEEARRAVDLGADAIVAQGTEAGGHGARRGRSTLPFVPVVVDLAAPVPVLAAGGIADGRGIAAALALGAAGALLGTRFQATAEALVDPAITKAIVEGHGQDTERSSVLDIVRGSRWSSKYTARTLGHPYLDRWRGREAELAADPRAGQDYQDDLARGAIPPLPVWAGEAVDLITDRPCAADLVVTLVAQAEDALNRAGRH
ncbi:NAD(P)H-dependent flavin oxidoreductase [Planomonospora venezuelensis]|uniref:Nitronate monooxygenase n=1 Tax=Planomonospora venezuelensis TaxID=1999 RepID=A0A841D1G3_PLAVE|nr:nitronate monooxygenase [Planomonospora venezuelensis]MBB5963329.1 nitronate monooxygenase [Planomonospora venezuelensis]GIN02735.1 2-nitropropane dioxygenase [Planomonospora venezuelensis]